jgi:hypothetical protein
MSGNQVISERDLEVVVSKAGSDPAFKARLLADGRATLATLGIKVADGVTVRFVEDTTALKHVVIPSRRADGQLTDSELDQVAGGLGESIPPSMIQIGRGPKL